MDRQTSTPPLVGDPQFFSIDKTPHLHVMILNLIRYTHVSHRRLENVTQLKAKVLFSNPELFFTGDSSDGKDPWVGEALEGEWSHDSGPTFSKFKISPNVIAR